MQLLLIQTMLLMRLKSTKDSIVVEKPNNNPYANLIAVRKDHKDDEKLKL